MKQCRTCNRTYANNSLNFCLEDGTPLSSLYDPEATQVINSYPFPKSSHKAPPVGQTPKNSLLYVIVALLALIAGGGLVALLRSETREASVRQLPVEVIPTPVAASSNRVQEKVKESPRLKPPLLPIESDFSKTFSGLSITSMRSG